MLLCALASICATGGITRADTGGQVGAVFHWVNSDWESLYYIEGDSLAIYAESSAYVDPFEEVDYDFLFSIRVLDANDEIPVFEDFRASIDTGSVVEPGNYDGYDLSLWFDAPSPCSDSYTFFVRIAGGPVGAAKDVFDVEVVNFVKQPS
jgi:hypothetical protein